MTKHDQAAGFYCFLPMITQLSLIEGSGTTILQAKLRYPTITMYGMSIVARARLFPTKIITRFDRGTIPTAWRSYINRYSRHNAIDDLPHSGEA